MITKKTDPAGGTTAYTYRPDGKLKEKIINNMRRWVYEYDTRGRIVSGTNQGTSVSTSYMYNAAGRIY